MQVTIMIQGAQHTQDSMVTGEGAAPFPKGHSTGGFGNCPSDPDGHGFGHFKVTQPKYFCVSRDLLTPIQQSPRAPEKTSQNPSTTHFSFPRTLSWQWLVTLKKVSGVPKGCPCQVS